MAEIFKGLTYDFSGIKKYIVIKRILPHIAANRSFIDMLVSEAKIAVNLSHGNIAQVYDLGRVGDDYFIVMEYVEGKNLSQILKKCREKEVLIPVDYAVYILAEICQGLDYMHRKKDESGRSLNIVHRDISPQNIILSESAGIKIVDFGVAKAALKLGEREQTALKGKFAYMAPEQAKRGNVDARADLFSAGVLLWEMLTGQRLFKKETNVETMRAVCEMGVLPPSQFRADLPAELDPIVLKVLRKKPEERFASAHDLGMLLTRFLLKYYPEFKPSQMRSFFSSLFAEEEDPTRETPMEKTVREDSTLIDPTRTFGSAKSISMIEKVKEDTAVVNPLEIDFHSIFSEIAWEDLERKKDSPKADEKRPLEPSVISEEEIEKPFGTDEEISFTGEVLASPTPLKSSSPLKSILFFVGFILVTLLLIFGLRYL